MHNNIVLPNNSVVLREEIGEGDKALCCRTLSDAQCGGSSSPEMLFPNKTVVLPGGSGHTLYSSNQSGVVYLNRKEGNKSPLGTYYCNFTDRLGNTQQMSIRVGTFILQFSRQI